MDEELKRLVGLLNDASVGWVNRRDAAESLGAVARQSVSALVDHLRDKDMDVQMAVERCLEPMHVIMNTSARSRKRYTIRDLAFSCEKQGARGVETYKTGFVITVKLKNDRSHRVYIMPHKLRDGRKIVRLFTLCGEASPERYEWALRTNTKLSHGAFALLDFSGSNYLVIINNIVEQEAQPDVIKRCVKEMAYFGDWLEEKISKMDEL